MDDRHQINQVSLHRMDQCNMTEPKGGYDQYSHLRFKDVNDIKLHFRPITVSFSGQKLITAIFVIVEAFILLKNSL